MGMPVIESEMQEDTMKQMQTLKLMIAGIAGALAVAATPASAQTATTATAADAFTMTPTQTFSASGKPTSSTPRMVKEAIQRSQARSQKLLTTGTPEKWGSEEPFTFNPNAQ